MQFTIESEEGLPIRGDLTIPVDARATVVVIHGFKGFRQWGFFPWLSERLADHGFAVCRFDMSRNGIGDDPETFDRLDLFEGDTYSGQLSDLRRVLAHVAGKAGDLPLFLLGHSRGGGIALLAARDVAGLSGVIAWSPISRTDRWDEATKKQWRADGHLEAVNQRTRQVMRMSSRILDDVEQNQARLDILSSARELTVPLLVVHGARDESVPLDEGRAVAESATLSALVVIERAGHTFNAIHPLVDVPFELRLAAEVSAHFVRAWA
jgi:pimeloyl-ACP methyl ester carboxylesterase